jgi:hypothetical protein
MQKLVTYGLLTSLCALLTSACADSEGERPGTTAGTGGTAGQTATNGGSGGTAGSGGTGGTPGTGGTGAAAPPACSGGCVEITVPVTAPSQQAQFIFRNGTTTYDMTDALVVWRIRLVTPASEIPGDQMFVTPFAQNNDPYPGVFRPQTTLSTANGFDPNGADAWVNVTFDMANTAPVGVIVTPPAPVADAGADGGADAEAPPTEPVQLDNAAGAFDKATVFQYGIQVGVLGTYAGTGGNVHIVVDSVTYRTVGGAPIATLPDQTFTSALEGLQLDGYMAPTGTGAPIWRQ